MQGMSDDLARQVREALEGESNDAEHDALAAVAESFEIPYNPDPDDDSTKLVHVSTAGVCDIYETWEGRAPAYLEGGELRDWCGEALYRGDLSFMTQDTNAEREREITKIDVVPEES
jgi:hypothetical protein